MKASEFLFPAGPKKLDVGIHTNVKLTGIEIGNSYFEITFTGENGYATKRVFEPTIDYVYPREGESNLEALERMQGENLSVLSKLLSIYLTIENFERFEAPTYKEFVAKAKQTLDPIKGKKGFNLKVRLDKNKVYPELGYGTEWFEEYKEGEASNLAFTPREIEEGRHEREVGPVKGIKSEKDRLF